MFKNYFKIALRNLLRHKSFSAINILGLSIGIATCLIIMLFVQNELSYDRYNKKADRIVRVVFKGTVQGNEMKEASVMPPVAQALRTEFPEVQEATRLSRGGVPRITIGEKVFREDEMVFVDSNFFQVFTLPFVKGDSKSALIEPNTIVISKAIAEKYFGKDDPMGKLIVLNDEKASYKITGVMDNIPVNSHFRYDLFASMAGLEESRSPSWMTSNFFTYLVLQPGYDYYKLEAKLPGVVERHIGPQMLESMGITLAEFRKKGNDLGFFLQPVTSIHLHSDMQSEMSPPGDLRYVYIFSVIALFMLAIACINFMNLSTASASKRAREVGIRKVLGSVRFDLIRQFLLESILLTCLALLLSIVLVYIALPFFNQLSGKNLSMDFSTHPWFLPTLLIFGLVTGVLAGGYPAFFLSSFKPVAVLKGRLTAGRKSISLRSGLVVFQFFISIILIVGTTVVYKQLAYIQHKKLGYDKDQVIVVQDVGWLGQNADVFRAQLSQDPRVMSVSSSGYLPAGPSNDNNFFVFADNNSSQLVKTLRYEVDEMYLPTLGINLAAGRNFSKEFGTDSSGIIINETAAKAFGWNENALGHTLSHSDKHGVNDVYHVVGIVKDFHFRSLHERISPLVMVLQKNYGALIVKAKGRDITGLLATMKKEWTALHAEIPFSYSFLDDRFNNMYAGEQKTGIILAIFAGLTIFVACLGLFGLVTFMAEQRTKEIGIRKVLGASVTGVVKLLSRDFIKLVLIAFVIAAPIAWFIMNKWLQDFAYRINISWWVFVVAAIFAIVITLITISFRAIRAAVANPVESLRNN